MSWDSRGTCLIERRQVADLLGGDAAPEFVGADNGVWQHDRAGTDDGALLDVHAAVYDGVSADDNVVLDGRAFDGKAVAVLIVGGDGGVEADYDVPSELHTLAYHAYVPSFGDWGFVLAGHRPIDWKGVRPLADARFVTADTLPAMPRFPPDSARLEVRPNTLLEHALVGYYRQGWSNWYE